MELAATVKNVFGMGIQKRRREVEVKRDGEAGDGGGEQPHCRLLVPSTQSSTAERIHAPGGPAEMTENPFACKLPEPSPFILHLILLHGLARRTVGPSHNRELIITESTAGSPGAHPQRTSPNSRIEAVTIDPIHRQTRSTSSRGKVVKARSRGGKLATHRWLVSLMGGG